MTTNPKKVIFDCDNTMGLPFKEIDDGLTLLYLLGRSDIELVGITTTFGNGTVKQSYEQTATLLRDLSGGDIPIFLGADKRGCGVTEAANFLAQTVAADPGEIVVLATGPLGNLRAAAELDAAFFGQVKQIVCMGGYLQPLRLGWRNIAELNLSADPEATLAVLKATCPVTLMTAHVCLQAAFGWPEWRQTGFWNQKIRGLVRNWWLAFGLYCGVKEFYLWDLLPAVFISHPDLFDTNQVGIDSTLKDLEMGRLVLSKTRPARGVNMPTGIKNINQFKKILYNAWKSSSLSSFRQEQLAIEGLIHNER